jgi:hypothetical protein
MKKDEVILKCYKILENETPLNFDCGKICDGKCCRGDENTGMLLFPGEETLIDENIKIKISQNGEKIAVCNGSCNRKKRPLSCRIYPFFPLVKELGERKRVKIIFDLRADCPLIKGEYEFNKEFLHRLKRVGKYLLLNEEAKKFYLDLCDDLNEQIELLNLLG